MEKKKKKIKCSHTCVAFRNSLCVSEKMFVVVVFEKKFCVKKREEHRKEERQKRGQKRGTTEKNKRGR